MTWLLILAIVGLAIVGYDNWRLRRELNVLEAENEGLARAYISLEVGADEQQVGFEQEYLTWAEKEEMYKLRLQVADDDIKVLTEYVEYHNTACLPNMALMGSGFLEKLPSEG